jgi:3-dehydroquinate synthase
MSAKNSRIFTISPWEKLKDYIKDAQYSTVFLLCDDNTKEYCLPYLQKCIPDLEFEITVIPVGELSKSLVNCETIWSKWLKEGIDRNSLILCLGGGVVCDIGGFCASTIVRGVDCIYIPTSLMAIADAAIGGKTGINFQLFKNQVGTFTMPKAIVIEPAFLRTLPERQLRNGFVEIIKHSLIQSPTYFHDITSLTWPLNDSDLFEYLKKSIRTKTDIIEQDFTEKNIRKALNFGHTVGHAFESYFLEKGEDILHGEAIAKGLICESYISNSIFKWKPNLFETVRAYLKSFTGGIEIHESDYEGILSKIEMDKKRRQKTVYFSLLESPGKPQTDQKVSPELILKSLEYLA